MMKKIKQQEKEMRDAQNKMTAILAERWPTGCNVMVMLSYNQRIPTRGTVINHRENYLRVKLDTGKQSVKDVHFENVI